MNKEYICYCGLYCENCAIKTRVNPAAKVLYHEMKKAGFDDVVNKLPGGNGFWSFLKDMAENWTCVSCRQGSGNPDCEVRICAQKKGVEICALCKEFPCKLIDNFDEGYPILKFDNALLREHGMEEWAKLQDERLAKGFTYRGETE